MIFNSLVFIFAFLPVAYLVFWALRTARSRYIWLTVTGYVFYGYWDPRFCLLMLFTTLVSYGAGLGFLRYGDSPALRKLFLIVPITVDLSLLGFFKYAGFTMRSINDLFSALGVSANLPVLDIILPVGISFYTFHTISYIVDAYRRDITPTRNFFEFSAYVSLFSQLVAGPIVRFRQIERDLESLGQADRTRWLALGISFFLFGLVEKVIIADGLAHYVDPAFENVAALSTIQAWMALLSYSMQLYFDFSGYSSMAVGLGLMFGLRIPQNFNSPYKALNPSEFWQRWHISLSTCMRDYLYISFGGNRHGQWRTYRNLMLTMLIGGLWHGASWNFIIWGAYHGVALITYRAFSLAWDTLPVAAQRAGMCLCAIIGWVPFRCATLTDSQTMFVTLFSWSGEIDLRFPATQIALLAIALAWAMSGPNAFDYHKDFRYRRAFMLPWATVFGACLAIIAGGRNSPFLYFQF